MSSGDKTKSWLELVADLKRAGTKFDPGSKPHRNSLHSWKRSKPRSAPDSSGSDSATGPKDKSPSRAR